MADIHLWFNGYDHAPGATAQEASASLQRICGISADEAEGDGWTMLPDDAEVLDEDGSKLDPPVTAAEWAASMLALDKAGVAP